MSSSSIKLNVTHVRQIQYILSRQSGKPAHCCGQLSGPNRSLSQTAVNPIKEARHSSYLPLAPSSSLTAIHHHRQCSSSRSLSTSTSLLSSKSDHSHSDKKPSLNCPQCGSVTCHVESFTGAARFVKCDKCQHFFSLMTEPEVKTNPSTHTHECVQPARQPIPAPRKICQYLDKFVIGQTQAKKVLSVAVYNHYKRVNCNIPVKIPTVNSQAAEAFSHNSGFKDLNSLHSPGNPMNIYHSQQYVSTSQQHTAPPMVDESRGSNVLDSHNHELKLDKSNILLLGPTGSGKTLLAQTIAQCLDVPFAMCDCTTITQAGYVGEDIDSVILKLLTNANYDVDKAERGIIFLDEVDKLGSIPGIHQLRDVGGEGVQQGLLKLLEGSTVNITDKATRSKMKGDKTSVDTTNILFVASGAFTGLERIVSRRKQEKYLGFGAPANNSDGRRAVTNDAINNMTVSDDIQESNDETDALLSQVEARDLIKFGLIPEFCGRFPMNVSLASLNEDMLVKILTEPHNALVHQFETLFRMDNCHLNITKDGLQAIARKALENQTGARGLRSIIEKILLEAQYYVPDSDVEEVIVGADVVNGLRPAQYLYRAEESDGEELQAIKATN